MESKNINEMWHTYICSSQGCYIVNDPEVNFLDHEEAESYCDERNRSLFINAGKMEREKIVSWLRSLPSHRVNRSAIAQVECGDYLEGNSQ